MFTKKTKCPMCGCEVKYHLISGKTEQECDHILRFKPKLNAWLCNIFAFVSVLFLMPELEPNSKLSHLQQLGIEVVYVVVACLLALIIILIVYKLFGFENLYKVEERKNPVNHQ
ncbi:MAG: hypothetical protein RR520_02620 [Erysipelotrichaceae bacterium]